MEQVRDIQVRWHAMSLYFLNKDRDLDASYQEKISRGCRSGAS